jgi:predicted nucleotidyltransferase
MSSFGNIPNARVDRQLLEQICARYRVQTLRVYGSIIRGDFEVDSDIDVLVEFAHGIDPDLLELGGLQQDLSEVFGREVDLKTPDMFAPSNLIRIVDSSVLGYAA